MLVLLEHRNWVLKYVIEKEIGGVCLNWGCIPTKALLKSAQVLII
jgi:pyruvate/2-oxoglutarate dehydrogenase complex dihydrolipoamide dehydrogenase (E3) component